MVILIKRNYQKFSTNLKEFLKIDKTDFENYQYESEEETQKEIFGYYHQINQLEKQNHLLIIKMMQLQKILN